MADSPRSQDPQLVLDLHGDLVNSNFTVDGVTDLLGERAMDAWLREQPVPARVALYRAGETQPRLATVIALFLLGDAVPAADVDAALPTVGAAGLARLGLLEDRASAARTFSAANISANNNRADGHGAVNRGPDSNGAANMDLVRASVDLRPYSTDVAGELYVVSDLGAFQRPGVLRRDHVLGIGGASLTLVRSTERREVNTALDVGTGCGIQTFHLLSHARHVVATDLSDRALATTRFNVLLNARALDLDPYDLEARVTLVQGSLLEPVAGQEFDLVVSNPPFVITPRRSNETDEERFTYRDGGMAGDRLVSELITALPTVMAPGGTAHLLANWEIPDTPETDPEKTWSERVAQWIAPGTGAWVIQREIQDVCEYAETWLRDASQQRDLEAYEAAYRDYLADFTSRRVGWVGFGMVRLSRPETGRQEAEPLQIFEHIDHPIQQPIAATLAEEWLRGEVLYRGEAASGVVGDDAWQDKHYDVAQDVTEERHSRPGAEDPALILLRQGGGLRRTVVLSSEAAGFVGVCDGELTARQILTALGSLLGWEDGPSEQLLREIRALITHGLLVEV